MSAIIAMWGWPQWTLLSLAAVTVLVAGAKHGEPKGDWNAGASLVAVAIELLILTAGGFFG